MTLFHSTKTSWRIVMVAVLLCASCSPSYVHEGYVPSFEFFSRLNQAGVSNLHELIRVSGVREKGSDVFCDKDTCRWIGLDQQYYALPYDSIAEIRFHSKVDAFVRTAPYTGPAGITLGAVWGTLMSSTDTSGGKFSLPTFDKVPEYVVLGLVTGLAFSAVGALIDGEGRRDTGYTIYVFRHPQPGDIRPTEMEPPAADTTMTRRSRGKRHRR